MDCPNCRLINPDTAQICDCGYNFIDKTMGARMVPADTNLSTGLSLLCVFIPPVGILICLVLMMKKSPKLMSALKLTVLGIAGAALCSFLYNLRG